MIVTGTQRSDAPVRPIVYDPSVTDAERDKYEFDDYLETYSQRFINGKAPYRKAGYPS